MTEQETAELRDPHALAYDAAEVECYGLIRAADDPDRLAEAITDALHSLQQRYPGQTDEDLRTYLGGALVHKSSVFLYFAAEHARQSADGVGKAADDFAAAEPLVLGLAQLAEQTHPDAAPVQHDAYRRALALFHFALTEQSEENPLSRRYRIHWLSIQRLHGPDARHALLNAFATAGRDLAVFAAIIRGITLEELLQGQQMQAMETIEWERNEDAYLY
ncbi:hypothetical protein ACFVYG_33460 [Streptomyces sp. NPDC058256]|uniref:hypothetical protein n=1 Tax=Streptomyces sp. NPDC058256 TaxID=3346408 RepID=UPI0036DFB7D2